MQRGRDWIAACFVAADCTAAAVTVSAVAVSAAIVAVTAVGFAVNVTADVVEEAQRRVHCVLPPCCVQGW